MPAKMKITRISRTPDKKRLNEEWVEVLNEGDLAFNSAGSSIRVGRGSGRAKHIATLKAGLVIHPQERVRIVTGSPGKKSHGAVPEAEGVRNFYLFMKAAYLDREGLTLRLVTKQEQEVCSRFVGPDPSESPPAADTKE